MQPFKRGASLTIALSLLTLTQALALNPITFHPAALQPLGRQMPFNPPMSSPKPTTTTLTLTDALSHPRSISIFASLLRSNDAASARLADTHANTTVLAPSNMEMAKLPRKPWESQEDYAALGASAYDGTEGEGRAQKNLKRFVEVHVLPTGSWAEGERVSTVGGKHLWWDDVGEGKRVVRPDGIEVQEIAERAKNGEVWIIKGVVHP